MMRATRASIIWIVLLLAAGGACGSDTSTNMLQNASFESGSVGPDQWEGFGVGRRGWEFKGREGGRCVSIRGDGIDTSWWYAKEWEPVEFRRLYRVSYWVRAEGGRPGGEVLGGVNLVRRRARVGEKWERREFFFRAPDLLPDVEFRLAQKGIEGVTYFDEVGLHPAVAVHRSRGLGRLALGTGEKVIDRRYSAVHEMAGVGSSDCRFLESYTAEFEQDRWVLDERDEVVYRHEVSRVGFLDIDRTATASPIYKALVKEITEHERRGLRAFPQDGVTVELEVARMEGGGLRVEVSPDGKNWTWKVIGEVEEAGVTRVFVPGYMMPRQEFWVRIKAQDASRIELTGYRYTSLLGQAWWRDPTLGSSWYFAVLDRYPGVEVNLIDVGEASAGGRSEVRAVIANESRRRRLRVAAVVEKEGEIVSRSEEEFFLGTGSRRLVYLPYSVREVSEHTLKVMVTDAGWGNKVLSLLEGRFEVSPLWEGTGGEVVVPDPELMVWWCEPERKVSKVRPTPTAPGRAVRICAAGNEYEAAQVVLKPYEWLRGCQVSATDLVGKSGARIPASEIEIRRAVYVLVQEPTDGVGDVGEWPDPLPRHEGGADLHPGHNHPFWVTVHVPGGTAAGDYRGRLVIEAEEKVTEVPLVVHVWGFDLPEETHVKSGCGLARDWIWRHHCLGKEEEFCEVRDLYLRSFASHRVSPISVGRPIRVKWEERAKGGPEAEVDFSEFDEDARRALEEMDFDAFAVQVGGLRRVPCDPGRRGEAKRFVEWMREHEGAFVGCMGAVRDHLAEKGWLDRAYAYWFHEPRPGDTAGVREAMRLLEEAAPEIRRMVTGEPMSGLGGAVDVWCIPIHGFEPGFARARQAVGEAVWWYPGRQTKAPHLTLFIDHYGTEPRLWLWATWKYGVDGILVPETTWWSSEAAYPEPKLQDPWEDAMSWESECGGAAGGLVARGNGDGRLLYPPRRDPGERDTRVEGPVPSVRWELLRDGMEDYEYFWLLREEVERLKRAGAEPSVYRQAEGLLKVPTEVCADVSHFATTPEPIHAHRRKLAEAIERLRESEEGAGA